MQLRTVYALSVFVTLAYCRTSSKWTAVDIFLCYSAAIAVILVMRSIWYLFIYPLALSPLKSLPEPPRVSWFLGHCMMGTVRPSAELLHNWYVDRPPRAATRGSKGSA